ncbi:MAG: peptidoglycan editing factor PgeF [Caldilineaceae bacterium]|nr:peptidoglycan editing factor PgeF [Caldilineaceae bacterium]
MRRICYNNGVVAYAFESLASFPLQAHVSARHGGVSPEPWHSLNFSYSRGDERERVLKNFARLCGAIGKDPSEPVRTHQIHSTNVAQVGWEDAGTRKASCDALITDAVDLPLFLVFADCVPLVIYDPARHVLGACHAGWRGTVDGMASAALRAMNAAFGTDAADVHVGIGPSIGPESYEVGEEVIGRATSLLPGGEKYLKEGEGVKDGLLFDLWQANIDQLTAAGVPREQIELSGIDTARRTDEFYSHRAEEGRCGLFGLLTWLEPRGQGHRSQFEI